MFQRFQVPVFERNEHSLAELHKTYRSTAGEEMFTVFERDQVSHPVETC